MKPAARRSAPTATMVLTAVLAALLWATPHAAAAPVDPALEQTVTSDEEVVDGHTVISAGHVDLGPRYVDGAWALLGRDDTQTPSVWRTLDDLVLHLSDDAVLPAPDDPEYAFLGVPAGTPLHVIPQTEDHRVPWLGWNTQHPDVVATIDRGSTLALHGVEGPGRVLLFLQEGVAGAPNVLWDSAEPMPQEVWMEVNSHTHANWVFSEPGHYLLDLEVRADLQDATSVTDRAVLRLAVGTDTDPTALLPEAAPAAAPPSPDPTPVDTAPDTPPTASGPADTTDVTSDPADDDADDSTDTAAAPAGATAAPRPDLDPASTSGTSTFTTTALAVLLGLVGLVVALVLGAFRRRRTIAAAEHDMRMESTR